MKILFYYEQLGYGGVDTHLANLINYWPDPKDQIVIASNRDNEGLDFLKRMIRRDNVKVKTLYFYSGYSGKPFIVKIASFFWNRSFRFFSQFLQIINNLKPDVILSDNGGYPGGLTCFSGAIIAKLCTPARRTALLIHHAPASSGFLIRKLADLFALCINLLHIPLVTVSQASKKSIEKGTPLKNFYVINNGIGAQKNVPIRINLRDRYQINPKKFILGMIGPIDSHKGHKVLIESFAKSVFLRQNACVVIVGKGNPELEEKLREFSSSLKASDAVTFTGFLPDESETIIKQFDVLVMPTTEFEGFGYSLAEAMSCGVAVVASRVGAIPDIIEDGKTGILVPPQDHRGLAVALEQLINDHPYRRRIEEEARKSISLRFSAEKMAREYYDLLKNDAR